MTVAEIITDALNDIGVLAAGETPSSDLVDAGLRLINRINDRWAARRIIAFNVDFTAYTFVPNLSPHTIGPSGATFTVSQRPVTIESASVILTTSNPPVDVPMNVRDDDWWANQSVKSLTSTFPTDVYYSPGWPNGSLFFWPIPTTAYGVRLETWTLISQYASSADTFSMPPGYWDALTLALAVKWAPRFPGIGTSPDLLRQYEEAMRAIEGNNSQSPRMMTAEAGQGNRRQSSMFNWQDGQIV